MGFWTHINLPFFSSNANHEIVKKLSSPILNVVLASFGFAAGLSGMEMSAIRGYLSSGFRVSVES